MVQGTRITVVDAKKAFSVNTADAIAALLKLSKRKIDPKLMQEMLTPALNKIYRRVLKQYHDLIRTSSLRLGAYNRLPGSAGAYQTGTLFRALVQDSVTLKKTARGQSLTWGMSIASPAKDPGMFERADRGWVNADHPNLGVLLRWASLRYGWGLERLANRKSNLLKTLRKYEVRFGGTTVRADRALMRLWRALSRRRYKGLRLKKHIRAFTKEAVAEVASGGRLLTGKELARLLLD